MSSNQKGFSALVIIIAIVIIGLIGAVGWLVYERQNKEDTNKQTVPTKTESKTPQNTTKDTQEATTKQYKGKLVTFQYPNDWNPEATTRENIDEFMSLKSSDYATEPSNIGGTQVKDGAVMNLSIVKTNASSPMDVEAPLVRGGPLQASIDNKSVAGLNNTTIASNNAIEFNWQYAGDGYRVVEVVISGHFIHAQFDTAGDETATPEYQQFIAVLNSIKLN